MKEIMLKRKFEKDFILMEEKKHPKSYRLFLKGDDRNWISLDTSFTKRVQRAWVGLPDEYKAVSNGFSDLAESEVKRNMKRFIAELIILQKLMERLSKFRFELDTTDQGYVVEFDFNEILK